VPKLGPSGWSYLKFTRRAQDWATVGVAAVVRRSNGTIEDRAIALTNMGPTPVRARAAGEALRTAGDVAAAGGAGAGGSDPPGEPILDVSDVSALLAALDDERRAQRGVT